MPQSAGTAGAVPNSCGKTWHTLKIIHKLLLPFLGAKPQKLPLKLGNVLKTVLRGVAFTNIAPDGIYVL